MEEKKKIDVNLNIDMNELAGRFSNVFQVGTFGTESRLDCVYVDKASATDGNPAIGKVVARISMTTDSLIELRELLDRHIDGLFGDKEADDGE